MPRPPSSFGRQTRDQARRQWPPHTCSPPFHKKAQCRLSIALNTQRGTSNAMSW
uniref:Uncharacterized protein n=1 Tax=Arundo donax TaxID=35708 RepID=A0A0A9GRM2_ARUDO